MKDRAGHLITQRAGADDQTTRVGADQMINDRADQMIKLGRIFDHTALRGGGVVSRIQPEDSKSSNKLIL